MSWEEGKKTYRSIGLSTSEGRVVMLTPAGYRGGAWVYQRPLQLLNAWLGDCQRITAR